MQQSPERGTRRLCLGGLMGLVLCASAAAQTDAASTLERQSDDAFRQVLQQPQDLGLWSKYAQLLIQAGNYEGGIAALERLLLDPQASPDLRVDIAALYFRLGSYAMAESMLNTALADSRLQGEKRAIAVALLADVHKRNQRSQFSGHAMLGLRHQSNPTYRTDRSEVLSGGVLAPLPLNQRPESDDDISLGLRVQHLYDLDFQNSASIVSTLGAYLVGYSSSSGSDLVAVPTKPYNLQLIDFTTGLQFKPMPGDVPGLTLRPHIILSNLEAQEHQYLRNHGVGLDVAWRPGERTLFELTLDAQDRSFANRIDVTNANLLGGRLYGLRARVSQEVGAGQVLVGEYAARRSRTERAFYDYDSNELRLTYSMAYRSPMAAGGYWTTAVWVGALNRSYGAPDPSVTAATTREDREMRYGISHTMPITGLWSVVFVAEHSRNNANLPNFRYKNTSLSGAVMRSF